MCKARGDRNKVLLSDANFDKTLWKCFAEQVHLRTLSKVGAKCNDMPICLTGGS
jgi:hypothetical protein